MITATRHRSRAVVLLVAALLLTFVPPSTANARGGPSAGTPGAAVRDAGAHEVWSLDQGTDLIHVHDSRFDLAEVATIDLRPAALGLDVPSTVPHMIEFDSEYRYAFVAATASARTIVIDARTKEVVAVLATGAGSHMAAVTPDDRAVWVAAIGAGELVEIPLDLDAEQPVFEIGRRIDVRAELEPLAIAAGWTFTGYQPVCHQFTPDSREAWVTLGPGWNAGGLFVLDLESGEITHAWDPEVVKANCGVGVNPQGTRVIANWSGRVVAGDDSEGEWYVFDAVSKDLLRTESARGLDAHGVRFTPDGRNIWAVNRNSDNALLINARNFEVVRAFDRFADTPDILDFSPDGSLVYVSQRGPTPRSGAIHAAQGNQPGVAVVHTGSGRTLRVLEPPVVLGAAGSRFDGEVLNDIHGVGVRPLSGAELAAGRPSHSLVRASAVTHASPATMEELGFGCHIAR